MNNLSNYGWGLPIQASTYAEKIDLGLTILHGVMFTIFILWAIYLVYCLIRYRKKEGVPAQYAHKATWTSLLPDGAVLFFEIWLIFAIGIPVYSHIKNDLPQRDKATEVRIVAEQFAWTIHYPGSDGQFGKTSPALINADNPLGLDPTDTAAADDIVSVNNLYIPLGKPVLIQLSSLDVIHSLFIPEFRMKQDAVPGMKIPVWFEPKMEGEFEIGCAQLCGAGHYRMRGDVTVLSPKKFQDWLASHKKG